MRGTSYRIIVAGVTRVKCLLATYPIRTHAQPMTRSYVRVLVVWAITLLALYGLQEYFS